MEKLNLGCGNDIKQGWINVDRFKNKGVDVVHDLETFPYPFKTNSVDKILLDNTLEHLEPFEKVLFECQRILKPNGKLIIYVPFFSNPGSFIPQHKHWFRLGCLDIYCDNTPQKPGLKMVLFRLEQEQLLFIDHFFPNILTKTYCLFPKLIYKLSPKIYQWFFSYLFPASQIKWVLKKYEN